MKAVISILSILYILFMAPAIYSQEAEESDNIGWVTGLSGEVIITRAGDSAQLKAAEGAEIYLNDKIETSAGATLTIQFDDDSLLTLAEGSKVELSQFVYSAKERNLSYFKLFYGRIRGLLNSTFGTKSEMSIETTSSVAGVRGSDISVWIEDGETSAAIVEGEGFIRHRDKKFPGLVKLKAGQMIRARKAKALDRPFAITDHARERIKKLPVVRKKALVEKLREKRKLKKIQRLKKRKDLKPKKRERPRPGKMQGP